MDKKMEIKEIINKQKQYLFSSMVITNLVYIILMCVIVYNLFFFGLEQESINIEEHNKNNFLFLQTISILILIQTISIIIGFKLPKLWRKDICNEINNIIIHKNSLNSKECNHTNITEGICDICGYNLLEQKSEETEIIKKDGTKLSKKDIFKKEEYEY
jgi:hypothetical protein